jgi:hypothetical protein
MNNINNNNINSNGNCQKIYDLTNNNNSNGNSF